MTPPYTHEELDELKRGLEERLGRTEREYPEARPLPPMDQEEAHEMLQTLLATAAQRALTRTESFLAGQLLASYRMAIEARMLGRRGRYYVLSESDLDKLMRGDA
jgi:hypothetical protein